MAVSSIGVRIGLEGGKEFTDGLRGAAQEVKTYVAELKKAEGIKDPFGSATGQMAALHNAIKNQEQVVREWRTQVDLAIQKFGEGSPEVSKFREELAKAEGKLITFKDQLSGLSNTAVEIKGLGTFKRDMETMTAAVSAFKSEFKQFANLEGFSNVFTKASGMKSSLTSEIKAQEEVVKLLAEDYEKAARESGAFSDKALDLRGRLADANTELYNMRKELKELPNWLMLTGKEIKELGGTVQGYGNTLSGIGRSTRVVSAGATGILTGIAKESAEFEKQMSNVAKVQGLNVKASEEDAAAYKKLEERARELGRTTVFSAVEAAEALEILGRAGLSVEEAIALSGPALDLAAAEELEFAEATSILVDNLNALGYEKNYNNARKLADVLAQTSRSSNTNVSNLGESMRYAGAQAAAFGWSMEDLSLMLGLMADFGVKATQAGTGLRQGLKNLISPSDKTTVAMKKFNITLDDGKGGIIDNTTFLTQLRNAFGDLDVNVLDTNGELKEGEAIMEEYGNSLPVTKMEKLQAICDIFGTRAMPAMLALIRTAPNDFNDLTDAISKADGAAQEMAETAIDNLSGEWTLFIDQVKDLALELGQTLIPVLRDGLQVFRDFLQGFSGMDEGTKKTIIKVLALTAAVSPFFTILGGITRGIGGLISLSGSLVTGIGKVVRLFTGAGGLVPAMASVAQGAAGSGGVVSSMTSMGAAIGAGSTGVVGKLGGLAKAAAPFLLKGAVVVGIAAGAVWLGKKIYEHWDDIKEFLGQTWNAIKTMASDIWGGITTVISDVWSGVKQVAADVWSGITTYLSDRWNAIKTMASDIWSGITEVVTSAWDGVKKFTSDTWNGIKTFLSDSWNGIKTFATDVWGGVKTVISDMWNGVKTVTSDIWNGIKTYLTDRWNGIKTFATDVWGGVKTVISDVWNGVKTVTSDIWNGIKTFLTDRWNGIKTFATDVWGGVKTIISDVWNGVKTVTSDTWNGIKRFLTDNWNGIKTFASGTFDGVVTVVSDAWDGVKTATSVTWEGVKSFLSGLWEGIKTVGLDTFNGLASGLGDIWDGIAEVAAKAWGGITGVISNAWEGVKGVVSNAWDWLSGSGPEEVGFAETLKEAFGKAKGYMWATNLDDEAKDYAQGIMGNLADGLQKGEKSVGDVMYGMADMINQLFHHSTPDKGPLKDDDKWMPDMMRQFTKGIRDNIPMVQKAAQQAAAAMVPKHYAYMPEAPTGNTSTFNMGGISFTINAQPGQDVNQIADVVERRLIHTIERQQYVHS